MDNSWTVFIITRSESIFINSTKICICWYKIKKKQPIAPQTLFHSFFWKFYWPGWHQFINIHGFDLFLLHPTLEPSRDRLVELMEFFMRAFRIPQFGIIHKAYPNAFYLQLYNHDMVVLLYFHGMNSRKTVLSTHNAYNR